MSERQEFGQRSAAPHPPPSVADAAVTPTEPPQRLAGSIAANLMAVLAGAAIVRVHDVAETVQALRVAAAIRNAR